MLQAKFSTNVKSLKSLENSSVPSVAVLTMFLYLPQMQRQNMETLIQFFQKHNLKMQRIQDRKGWRPYILNNANFIVQSCDVISEIKFEHVSQFLFSNVIVVALFYQTKMWSLSRVRTGNKLIPFLPHSVKAVPFLLNGFNFFRKNLQKISF